ncbi:MAG TPA: hypothetical protein VJO34_12200 [Methylomirabilota bacterium]|nr:hypothetical protein [Methylomirabilota bacterium]
MPYNDPAPDDPTILLGVTLPAGEEAVREMAYVFAEEFARMGFDEKQLLRLFKNPFYAGAHQAYRALGADAIRTIIGECVNAWGRSTVKVQDVQAVQNVQDDLSGLSL